MPMKVLEAERTTNRLDKNRKSTLQMIIDVLKIQNKERIMKAAKRKDHITYKNRPIRSRIDFYR